MDDKKSIKIIVDNREHELIKKLQLNKSMANMSVENLDLGDIVFRDGNGDDVLVIERKTVNDLKASIVDGRGHNQKARLLATTPRSRLMYIIEGNMDLSLTSTIQNMPITTLLGSMINTMLRDDIKVYKTSSLNETVNFLIKLFDKLIKDIDRYFNQEDTKISATEYSSTIKKKKKANMTPEVWFISQLSQIPQITEKVAGEIIKVYPTVNALVSEYEKLETETKREKLLADIMITLKTGKERRIGDKISKRIYQFFYGKIDQEMEPEPEQE